MYSFHDCVKRVGIKEAHVTGCCHVVAMLVGQSFLSGSPSFSLYNVDYPNCAASVALCSEHTHTPGRSQKKRPFFFFVCFSFSFLLFSPPPTLFSSLSFSFSLLIAISSQKQPLNLLSTCLCVCVRFGSSLL